MLEICGLRLKKLDRGFYERDTLDVAKELLGKYLVHNIDGETLIGRITETEAYKENDKGAHFYNRKRTPRTEIAFGKGGFSYVYLIYGMYNCFNVTTEKEGTPGAVLVRMLEPICGIETMMKNRNIFDIKKVKSISDGPGKLCMAMDITKQDYGIDLTGDELFIAEDAGQRDDFEIKCGKRINIDYAEECKDYLWRFWI